MFLEGLYSYSTKVTKYYEPKHLPEQSLKRPILYLGVELEVRSATDPRKSSVCTSPIQVRENLLPKSFALCKYDASTGPGGFEICTIPATFEVHKTSWDTFFTKAPGIINCVTRSGTQASLGMHVHVSKNCFSRIQQGKFLVFYNSPENKDFLDKIAGRKEVKWCRKHPETTIIDPLKTISEARARSNQRYSAVNTLNTDTLEVRIFKSTLSKNIFMMRLEFVQASCEYCFETTLNSLSYKKFIKWLFKNKERQERFPNLCKYIKRYFKQEVMKCV